jgi:hypothetical protein
MHCYPILENVEYPVLYILEHSVHVANPVILNSDSCYTRIPKPRDE